MNEFLHRNKRALLCLVVCCTLSWGHAHAQTRSITGSVKDAATHELIPGVSVVVKGTATGTITDANGSFSIQVSSESDVLVFSFVGYSKTEIPVGGRSVIDLDLAADLTTLEEVVVVGYGEQKKSVVTGAISSVKASDLATMPITRIEQALQGRTSGLTIAANSGQPGSQATVRVRGITTLSDEQGGNNPLWVVDGVVVDNGGIGYLNQSDIESIEVLKDAASQAIYGARGAAGVILVTTKRGKEGKINVNYNGFFGTSAPARKLDLLNATQYATLRNEASVAAGGNLVYADPQALGAGTDWQDVIFNTAAHRQNHELSISGGNDKSTFYTSFGYLDQQGIVATEISNYNRINLRLNSTHKITKWLNVGQNLGYARNKTIGLGNTNSEFGGPLSSAINLDPTTPLLETDAVKASQPPYDQPGVIKDKNGVPYGISSQVGQEITNPAAYIQTRLGNHDWGDNIIGNAYAEVTPIKGLVLRSTLGAKLAFWGNETFTPQYYLNSSTKASQNSFKRESNRMLNWNIENTISYTKTIDVHSFNVLLGQGAYQDNNRRTSTITYFNIPATNFDDASFNFSVPTASRNASGEEGQLHTVSSIFTRLNYNYAEKYLLTAILRRDGSSRFGSNNKYGFFPSFSVGWVASSENFWPQNQVVNFMKVRGGYGVVGNDAIGDFQYVSTIGGGRNYTIGTTGYANGFSPDAPANPNLKWESTSQTNIGFEATVLNDLSITFDWYKKITSDILRNPRIPGYVGAIANPAANVADMQNTGIELELGYKKTIGEVNLSFNGNVSHMKNKVTFLGRGIQFLSGGETFQASSYPITRTAVGQPVYSFYGFKRMGIFQTQEEVNNYKTAEGKVIQPNAAPGDIIWADLNGDGSINGDDRTFLGNPTPQWTYGMTVSASYKGFDLVVFGQGVAGNTIFQGLRRLDVAYGNYQTKALGRWTGPGTSNDFPRLINGDPTQNNNFTNPSDLYLEKGDYLRLKTVQFGYTLPKSVVSKIGLQRTRVYIMSENLLTFTKYTGYDPEIGGNAMSIDRGIYPQARSFMIGLNAAF
jgi:TonB-linked SusC/RagA family outer membrane protein